MVSPSEDPLPLDPIPTAGEVLAGRYEVQELVGVGGMSSVYAATDLVLERRVAVKILHRRLAGDPGQVDRFRREANTAAGLAHENIVSVIDRGDDGGVPFIVFEYVPGENLKQLMHRTGPLPLERALAIAVGIADGLGFAHSKGFVHRDVKPHNVLLTGNGAAKITDFGIARSLTDEALTETGMVLGSADYIAPEQAQGQPVDEASDIYSLGAVLYELLVGRPPFAGETFVAVAMKHVREPPVPVGELRPGIPLRVERAVARALAKSPADRFPTMERFRQELQACRAEARAAPAGSEATLVLAPAATARIGRSWRGRRRLAVVLALLAVGLAAAAAALVVVVTRDGAPQPAPARAAPPRRPAPAPLALHAVGAYDPAPGDGVEDNARLPLATDGNPATAWATEWYASARFGNLKSGVGLVLDARRPVQLRSVTVLTDTPGFSALVKAGSAADGPFDAVSRVETVGRSTTFTIASRRDRRYYVIWITSLSPATAPRFLADVSEVTAVAQR